MFPEFRKPFVALVDPAKAVEIITAENMATAMGRISLFILRSLVVLPLAAELRHLLAERRDCVNIHLLYFYKY